VRHLARSVDQLGDLDNALELYRIALAMTERLPGPNSREAATVSTEIAALLRRTGREAEAAEYEARAHRSNEDDP